MRTFAASIETAWANVQVGQGSVMLAGDVVPF